MQRIVAAARGQPVRWQQLASMRLGSTVTATSSGEPAGRKPVEGPTLADFLPGAAEEEQVKYSSQVMPSEQPSNRLKAPVVRKPPWLRMVNPNLTVEGAEKYKMVRSKIKKNGLATVCEEAKCPNAGECWSAGTATVMIMGDTCTRGCRFCSVATSRTPAALSPDEPEKVADAVKNWGLDYVVLTMVDRDDLADQGSAHVAATVQRLKAAEIEGGGNLRVETLCGDFQGKMDCVETVLNSGMDVFAHNIETVERLTRVVRDRRATYQQTLAVLRHAREYRPDVVTKSSIMLGLGEKDEEVQQTMVDLRDAGVDIVTLGQYLQPTKRHMKVDRYVTPEEFDQWRVAGEALGLDVASGPLVRSSYKAGDFFKARMARRAAAEGASTTSAGPTELHMAEWGEPTQRVAEAA